MNKLNPRAQLRRDLNAGKVEREPRTEEQKLSERYQAARELAELATPPGWTIVSGQYERARKSSQFVYEESERGRREHVVLADLVLDGAEHLREHWRASVRQVLTDSDREADEQEG